MNTIPFLRPGDPEDVIAWRGSVPVTRAQFHRDLAALVARLPDRAYVLNHCDDRYFFLVGLVAALVRGQVSLFPPNHAMEVLTQLQRDFPGVYCLSDQVQPEEAGIMDVTHYDTGLPAGEIADPAFPPGQTVAIMFTSGSTGVPKQYPKTWGALTHEARIAGERLGLDATRGGHILATVPAQHMYGFAFSVIMPAQWGYVLGAERPFYPEDIRKALTVRPVPTMLVTTPLHIRACLLDGVQLPPLDFILSSTAPLDGELAGQAEARYTTRVVEFFGSTETGAIASRRQTEDTTWHSFDGIRVQATDDGFRVEAPHFSGPILLGDRVEAKNDHEFILLGRNTELLKIAGKRIALGDLNRHLLAIDGVVDGTFFLPDARPGREPRLTAFVVAPGLTREQLLNELRRRIDPVFLPRPLCLVAVLPRNTTGKLPRGSLVQLFQEAAAQEATG